MPNELGPVTLGPEARVVVRFSSGPASYHLLEIYKPGNSVCIQIKSECPREIVALFASHVAGLGIA